MAFSGNSVVQMLLMMSIASTIADVDFCMMSGDPHFHTLDGATYDFQGIGVFTAVANDYLEVQVQLANSGSNHTYVRAVAVAVKGAGMCHAAECTGRHNIVATYGVNLENATAPAPDPLLVDFHHFNDSSQDFGLTLPIADAIQNSNLVRALSLTGLNIRRSKTDALVTTIDVLFEALAPIVISAGPGFAIVSTAALSQSLIGSNGICGLYSRLLFDEFSDAEGRIVVPSGKRNHHHSDELNRWAMGWAVSDDRFRHPMGTQAEIVANTTDANHLRFETRYSLHESLASCRRLGLAIAGTTPLISDSAFRQCVYDFIQTNDTRIGRSNYDVVVTGDVDAKYVVQMSPAEKGMVVQRRQSARTTNIISAGISSGLAVAFVTGMFANRRLRQMHSQELTVARANAMRLDDHL